MINLNETTQNINQNISQTINELSKNYLVNGDFRIAQKATSAVITAGTAVPTASLGYPVLDSWYAYSVGGNPTLAQVNSSGGSTPYYLQVTGAAGITSFGVGQRIEALNSATLALKTATVSFECSNSLLTSVSIAVYRPATTTNTFGTVGTPSRTLISNTSININSTLTSYDYTFTCPQEVDKGLEIVFTCGAQTSGTFVLSNVKLEEGAVSTPFTVRSYQEELYRCKRYFQYAQYNVFFYAPIINAVVEVWHPFAVQMLAPPVLGAIVTDPNSSPATLNNSTAVVLRQTKEGVGCSLTSANVGTSYIVGYRASMSSYIP